MIIEPDVFTDERGFFVETFQEKRYQEALGNDVHFVQDNLSVSKKGVLRGLHYQAPPYGQAKLAQVLRGRALDVVVDIRNGSPTFGKHVVVELSGENHRQLFIPVGFAHGFLALEEETIFAYKCTQLYSKEHERGILWNDPEIGINWGVTDPIMAEKDKNFPLLTNTSRDYFFEKLKS